MPGRRGMPLQLRRCVLAVAQRRQRELGEPAQAATHSAFAICTSSLQDHGYLHRGTHQPTARGWLRSLEKRGGEQAEAKAARYQRLLKAARQERAASRFDRERFARHRAVMRGEHTPERSHRGAANRTSAQQDVCRALAPLREAMELVFSCETAYGTCKSYNPAAAHCFMASSLLQDLYGGEIVEGSVDGVPHYWAKVGRRYVDLTGDQFGRPPIQCSTRSPYPVKRTFPRQPSERDEGDAMVQRKYDLFKSRVAQALRGMGQRGMAGALE